MLTITDVMMMGSLCPCIVVLRMFGNGTGYRTAAMVAPLLTSGPPSSEAALHGYGTSTV